MAEVFYSFWDNPVKWFGSFIRSVLGSGQGKFRHYGYLQHPTNQKLILVDTSPGSLMLVAMQVPHLNTVISTGAQLFSMMEIKHLDKDGTPIKDSPILKLLKKPNPLQNQEQYTYEYYVMNAVYNKTFQHMIKPLSFERLPKVMWILPSGFMKINATGKIYRQSELKQIIESFEMWDENNTIFETEKVIYICEGLGNNPLNPISKIEALQIPLSNIMASLKSRNIIVSERGGIGFLAPEQNNVGDSVMPYDDDEHTATKKEYQKAYSLDSDGGHVFFPKVPLKWTPMTFDTNQLGLEAGTESDFSQIIAAFNHDRDIYPSVKGATFENKAAGMRATIQNCCAPLAEKWLNALAERFIDPATGQTLVPSYDHLPCMQEDKQKEATANQINVTRLSKLYEDGIINEQQYAKLANVDFDEPQPEETTSAQRQLRRLVGSVSGIIQINQFVATGFMDKESGINVIMAVYGYEREVATTMITNTKVDPTVTAPTNTIPQDK